MAGGGGRLCHISGFPLKRPPLGAQRWPQIVPDGESREGGALVFGRKAGAQGKEEAQGQGVTWPRKSGGHGAQHGAPRRFSVASFPMGTSSNECSDRGPECRGNVCCENEDAAGATRQHAMCGCAGKRTQKNKTTHNQEVPVVEVMTRKGVLEPLLG